MDPNRARSLRDRERRLEELFQLAADLPQSERAAFYARHCGDDIALERELDELLRQDDEGTKDFLQSPVIGAREKTGTNGHAPGEALPEPGSSFMPERIGRYLILERIGEGGMGSVYLAEQEHPVRRRVALKIVKPGMDTERVIQRFELERQALAMMDHPCIARIFDGGATAGGRPYFVMEYAPGLPISRFCDRENLGVKERLQLFCLVCEAVQHAHQKGIIHRDIKPTNVLVSRIDGRSSPKVIDFGIARATSETFAERTHKTGAAEVVGTCYYMSPEQADPNDVHVDTRTDIYSLGVMLYELLAGVLPMDSAALRGKTALEVQDILRHTDPVPPSTRVTRLGDTTAKVALDRNLDARGLASRLSGDLDWITLKAMEKDPARRYATAAGLAADVRRHLAHEPVLAGPPDVAYRLRKFVRRNRVAVSSGVLVLLALVAGIIGTTWGMLESARKRDQALTAQAHAEAAERDAEESRLEALRQHDEAERQRAEAEKQRDEALTAKAMAESARNEADRERQAADAARQAEEVLRGIAVVEARHSKAVTEFLVNALALADPEASLDAHPTLETMLLRAGERVETTFQGLPEGEATVRKVLGEGLHSLGLLDAAEGHLRRALDIQRGLEDVPPAELYATMARLAQVYGESDSRDAFALALSASDLAIDMIGEPNPELSRKLAHLVRGVMSVDVERAARYFEEVRSIAGRSLAPRDPKWLLVADVHEFLGHHLGYHWGSEAGIAYLDEALAIRRRELPAAHPKIARALNKLVTVQNLLGRHGRSEELVRESMDIYLNLLPPGHWLLAETRSLLGECLSGQGEFIQAEDLLVPSHDELVSSRGLVSRVGIDSTYRLVRHYEATNRPMEADVHRKALAQALAFSRNAPFNWGKQAAAFDEGHAELVEACARLDAMMMEATRAPRTEEAFLWRMAEALDRVIELRRKLLPDDDPRAVIVGRLLAEYCQVEIGQPHEIDRRMCEEILGVLGPHKERLAQPVASALMRLGLIAMTGENDPVRAEEYFGQAWELRRRTWGLEDEETLESQRELVRSQLAQRHFDEACDQLALTWEECMVRFGPRHQSTTSVLASLAEVYGAWNRPTALETFLEKHLRISVEDETNAHRLTVVTDLAVRTPGFSTILYDRALAASRRATELHPSHSLHTATTGKALYRLGRYAEAVSAIQASIDLSQGRYGDDWIFLAMCHHALGDAAAVDADLERLDAILASHPHPGDLARYLAELEALLPSRR